MNTQELLELHDKTCGICRQVMEKKNTDYCGGSDDPFANFRISEMLGVNPAIGIMMRMTDKMQRIKSFVNNGTLAVKTESFEDACEDLVNYAILLKGYLLEQSGKLAKTWDRTIANELPKSIEDVQLGCADTHHEFPRCGWRGFAGGEGCILRAGHEGHHKFSDGSGG